MNKKGIVILMSAISVLSFSNFKISDIEIKNNTIVPTEFILNKLPVKVGSEYTNKDLSDIQDSLLNLPELQSIKTKPIFDGNNVKILVDVTENQNAEEILKRDLEIQKLKEKTNLIVKSINIIGNNTVNVEKILQESNLKKDEPLVRFDLLELRANLLQTGYFNSVDVYTKENKPAQTVDIEVKVVENPVVKSVTITGSTLFLESELIKASKIEIGKPLNINDINQQTAPLLDLYKKVGVLAARITNAQMSKNGDLVIELSEGKISSIEFKKEYDRQDNERRTSSNYELKTKQFVLNRALAFSVGDILTTNGLQKTIYNLQRTGLFLNISQDIIPQSDQTFKVVFYLKERPTTTINANLSYTTSDGIVGGAKLSDANFLGRAENAGISAEFGTSGTFSTELNFFDPWIEGTDRIQAGGQLKYSRQRAKTSDINKLKDAINKATTPEDTKTAKVKFNNYEFISHNYGVNLSLGKNIYNNVYVTIKPSLSGTLSKNYYGKIIKDYTLVSVSPSIAYDTRDNTFTPKKGVYLQLTDELGYIFRNIVNKYDNTGKLTQSNEPGLYNKFEIDTKFYHPVYKDKNSMAYHLDLGYATQNTQNSFSNASGTIFRGINDTITGNAQVILSIENRTYISNYLQGVIFVDLGNIFDTSKTTLTQALSFENIQKTSGVGIRVNTPIGVIRLDYGWPLQKIDKLNSYGFGKGRLSFGFGQTF